MPRTSRSVEALKAIQAVPSLRLRCWSRLDRTYPQWNGSVWADAFRGVMSENSTVQ